MTKHASARQKGACDPAFDSAQVNEYFRAISSREFLIHRPAQLRAYGLGAGVGRPLGVGTDLGVGVGLGVELAVAVAVGVAVADADAVAVAVAVGLGVGVGVPPPTAAKISIRPQPYTLFGGPAVPHWVEEINTAELFKASRLAVS